MSTTQLVLLEGEDYSKRDAGFICHLAKRELMPALKLHRNHKMDLTKVDLKACHVNDDPFIYGPNYVYVRMNVEFIK